MFSDVLQKQQLRIHNQNSDGIANCWKSKVALEGILINGKLNI